LTKYIRHIAYTLLVVFIFPITYQPLHIIWHFSHGKPDVCCHNSICNIENSDQSKATIGEKDDHCPICDFEFSVNSISVHSVAENYVPVAKILRSETITEKYIPCIVLIKTPRAPPISA